MSFTEARIEGTPLIAPSTIDHPLYDSVVEACRTVFDPEIPVNIHDLVLVSRSASPRTARSTS